MSPRSIDVDHLAAGVLAGERTLLAQAITLAESSRPDDRRRADDLLARILPKTGGALRVGISGVPGAGKSTLIDTLGMQRVEAGDKVAVLAVDPSSRIRGGSILGDKTRMQRLSVHPDAYVRPSPSGGALGGVARATREALLLCEAAGFDVVLVETVGVGQSETIVAEMTDVFLALMIPGAGDELQSIKRGVLEWADVIGINKADGDREHDARRAALDFTNALRYLRGKDAAWEVPVVLCSALEQRGIDELWERLTAYRRHLQSQGGLEAKRRTQRFAWLDRWLEVEAHRRLQQHPAVQALWSELKPQIEADALPVSVAARKLLEAAET